jgi:hypothetical protein
MIADRSPAVLSARQRLGGHVLRISTAQQHSLGDPIGQNRQTLEGVVESSVQSS